jgi:hypothetical protein
MHPNDFNRAVAKATGESVGTIAQRGFVLLRAIPFERESRSLDDDERLESVPRTRSARRQTKRRAIA